MWLVFLVLLTGAVLLFLARTARYAAAQNRLFSAIERTRTALQQSYPQADFQVRSSSPRPRTRNVVINIVARTSDSTAKELMVDSCLAIAQRTFDAPGFDTLVIALDGVALRARPLR